MSLVTFECLKLPVSFIICPDYVVFSELLSFRTIILLLQHPSYHIDFLIFLDKLFRSFLQKGDSCESPLLRLHGYFHFHFFFVLCYKNHLLQIHQLRTVCKHEYSLCQNMLYQCFDICLFYRFFSIRQCHCEFLSTQNCGGSRSVLSGDRPRRE